MSQPLPLPQVRGFALVIGRDGRVKVDDWNAMTVAEQRAVAEYVINHYPRTDDGSDTRDERP